MKQKCSRSSWSLMFGLSNVRDRTSKYHCSDFSWLVPTNLYEIKRVTRELSPLPSYCAVHSELTQALPFINLRRLYSYSTTNKMHLLSQIIYSCKMLYMFRTVFPSIIRSSKLRIQQRYMSNSCCYLLQPVAAAVWHIPLLYTQFWAPADGRKDRPKHVEHFTRINNLR